jgi:hypothetical protein
MDNVKGFHSNNAIKKGLSRNVLCGVCAVEAAMSELKRPMGIKQDEGVFATQCLVLIPRTLGVTCKKCQSLSTAVQDRKM